LADRADANDWVLVHDAARPCVRYDDISRLIQQAEVHNVGALLGMPVHDTMKRTDTDKVVTETVERNQLWHALTPQMFRFGTLYQAMQDAIQAGYLVTDEASAIEWAGFKHIMVEGQPDNIKITQSQDLALAGFYLSQQ
jgi:2-C-methyl-D-erythritol 4-phosphate cytidylyltransferase